GGDVLRAVVARHLLVLEDAARILTLAGGTVRTVADGVTVRGTATAEVPAHDDAGEAAAFGDAFDVHLLAHGEVARFEFRADFRHAFRRDAEFHKPLLGLDAGLFEVAEFRLGDARGLFGEAADLDGGVAVLLRRALAGDLQAFH